MKNPTEPNTRITAIPAPFLPTDIASLMESHSVRIDESAKHSGAWDHPDVTTVRRAIRTWLRHFDCLTHHGHAVPLYWLHDWLMNGPCVGRRTPNPDAGWAAHLTLISALNQPNGGLSVVLKRSMVHV
jgi:GT2 family glycosyltransferase